MKAVVEALWPGGAPGASGDSEGDKPELYIYQPPPDKANGAAMVVCPGGGYHDLAMGHEGEDIGNWLSGEGIAAFILRYRLPPKYLHPAPLQDAQRAIRTVRARANEWGIDPARIAIMGFSAGGHLAATAGTHFDNGDSNADDPIERVGCRPDAMVLLYAVISMLDVAFHSGCRANLLGTQTPDPELVEYLSNERHVTAQTPPAFLAHTTEDQVVNAENSVLMYRALHKAGVPVEMHIYEQGRHGLGLAPENPVFSTWAGHCIDWLRVRAIL